MLILNEMNLKIYEKNISYYINILNRRKRLIDFTILQLLQHNVQLGCLEKFSLLTSN